MEAFEAEMIERLKRALCEAWCLETTRGEWSAECPSLNQCAGTAMVVQDYLGGEILRCPVVEGGGHFWNRLKSGEEVDLTREQFAFSGNHPLWEQAVVWERERLEGSEDTGPRYRLLKARVEKTIHPRITRMNANDREKRKWRTAEKKTDK